MTTLTPFQIAQQWETADSATCLLLKQHIVRVLGWQIQPEKLLISCSPWLLGKVIDVSVIGANSKGLEGEENWVLLRITNDSLYYAPDCLQG